MDNFTGDVRSQIAETLPNVLTKALKDYERFLEPEKIAGEPKKETSKEFKDRHDACKAALAHIALIIKVADEICGREKTGSETQQKILETLLMDARKDLENQEDSL